MVTTNLSLGEFFYFRNKIGRKNSLCVLINFVVVGKVAYLRENLGIYCKASLLSHSACVSTDTCQRY